MNEKTIEQTRDELASTISALETRLSAENMGAELRHVEAKVREAVREHLAEAKTLVREELVEAQGLLRGEMNEAEARVRKAIAEAREVLKSDLHDEWTTVETKLKAGLSEARDAVRTNLREALTSAKTSLRAATLGKVENFATDIGDTMNDTRDTLLDTIRQNPLPAALAGVGVAWLLMNRSKPTSARTRSRGLVEQSRDLVEHGAAEAGDAIHRVSEATGVMVHGASDLAGRIGARTAQAGGSFAHDVSNASTELAHRAGSAAVSAGTHAREGARSLEHTVGTALHESPLAFGVAAVAVGAAIGLALPRTPGEDRMMGDSRDALVRSAGSAVHDAAIRVEHMGNKTAERAEQLLRDPSAGQGGAQTRARPITPTQP